MIRRIGIDFGTSTTVVRVKNYEDNGRTPVGPNALDCSAVKFGGMDIVPSLVREWIDGSGNHITVCGVKAVNDRPVSTLWAGFKMELESGDSGRAEKAWTLTDVFFRYLYAIYNEDNSNGSFGDKADREETWVSHPVKWKDETARRLAESAEKAGFRNVCLMNEAKAAVTSVALRSAQKLEKELGLKPGDKYRVLLVDMGAGTTDLVLGEYTYAEDAADVGFHTEVCWPSGRGEAIRGGRWAESSTGFTCGGREFDRRLTEYLQTVLEDNGVGTGVLSDGEAKVKEWKETKLSPRLTDGEAVSDFEPFSMYQQWTGQTIQFRLDRTLAQEVFQRELSELIDLVNGCMMQTDDPFVDAVILVGGGSQWYFVQDLLWGKLEADGKRVLLRRKDRTRPVVLSVYRPQETVAQGLVLAAMDARISREASADSAGEQAPPEDDQAAEDIQAAEDNQATEDNQAAEAPVASDHTLWQREEYAECLARYFIYLFNSVLEFPWKDKEYAKHFSKAKNLAGQVLERLSRREEVRIALKYEFGEYYYVAGPITRANCNRWAKEEEYAPPFPQAINTPGHISATAYCLGTHDPETLLDDIREKQKEYLLTEEQRTWLRTAICRMGKRTKGTLSYAEAVAEGEDSVPMTSANYKQANARANIKRKDFQVYFCHRKKGFLGSELMITDMGVITCMSKNFAAMYSWYTLCLDDGVHISSELRETECADQLTAILKEFYARLRKDFQIDIWGTL